MRTSLRNAWFHWVPAMRTLLPVCLLLAGGLVFWKLGNTPMSNPFGEEDKSMVSEPSQISLQGDGTGERTLEPERIPSDAVAVVLPSTAELMLLDFPRHVLAAFVKGALPPWEMTMVISGYNATNASHLEAQDTLCTWVQNRYKGVCRAIDRPWKKLESTPLILIIFTLQRHNAATSRNLGASFTSAPLISFFDSDDIPHPQRLQVLQRIFNVHPDLSLLLHSFSTFRNQSEETSLWENYNVTEITKDAPIFDYPWSVYQSTYGTYFKENFVQKEWDFSAMIPFCAWLLNPSLMLHNGWPTVRREVFSKVKFNATFDRG
jgi:hypothetical protein